MRIYNKLVRDKIPSVIKKNEGKISHTCVLDDEEYYRELKIKLKEEIDEFLTSEEIEELCDVEEVLRAILDFKNVSYEEFEKIRLNKVEQRGAFKDKIYLESVED